MTLIFWPQECKTFGQCFIPRAGIMAPFAKYLGQRHSRGDSLPVEANLSIKEFQTPQDCHIPWLMLHVYNIILDSYK